MRDGMPSIRMRPGSDTGPGEYAQNLISHRQYQQHLRRKQGMPHRETRNFIRAQQDPSASIYKCKTCGAEFATPELLGAHWRAERPELIFPPGTEMIAHDRYRCLKCGQEMTTYAGAGQHVRSCRRKRRAPRTGPATCPLCGRQFSTWRSIGPHKRHCKGPRHEETINPKGASQ